MSSTGERFLVTGGTRFLGSALVRRLVNEGHRVRVRMIEKGTDRSIYHTGTMDEIDIATLAREIVRCFGREIRIVPGQIKRSSAPRSCPDITKLRALGL